MKKEYDRQVHLTFNSLYYLPEQYQEIADIIVKCMKLGFQSFILADPALMVYLREKNIPCEIHLSGETGEVNRRMVEVFQRLNPKRIIFHRKNSFADMKAVVEQEKAAGGSRAQTEFEAFVLNEQCQFTGAFCNSWHCDEMGYLCRIPCWLGKVKKCRENAENADLTGMSEETGTEQRGFGISVREDGLRSVCAGSAERSRNHPSETGGAWKLCGFYGKRYPQSETGTGGFRRE